MNRLGRTAFTAITARMLSALTALRARWLPAWQLEQA
jgi:hypothetical protein